MLDASVMVQWLITALSPTMGAPIPMDILPLVGHRIPVADGAPLVSRGPVPRGTSELRFAAAPGGGVVQSLGVFLEVGLSQ